jgi:methionyl-tRNA formyltransferase
MVNVILIGEDAAGTRTLQSLEQTGARIVAVMASLRNHHGPGMALSDLAMKLGYKTWPVELVKDPSFAHQVRDAKVDVIINAHSLFLIRKEVLEAPRLGCFNLHPGPLPRYAGLNSVCWAIYRGEKEHGVTLHKMVPEIDAGPIVYQAPISIESEDTGLSLSVKCVNIGVPLILQLLKEVALRQSNISLIPQDLTKREYFGREAAENGNLSWNRPARRIVDFVRASDFFPFRSPWGVPRTRSGNSIVGISKARLTGMPADAAPGTVGEERSGGIEVACADEWILVLRVFQEGKWISAREVLKERDKLADCFDR